MRQGARGRQGRWETAALVAESRSRPTRPAGSGWAMSGSSWSVRTARVSEKQINMVVHTGAALDLHMLTLIGQANDFESLGVIEIRTQSPN